MKKPYLFAAVFCFVVAILVGLNIARACSPISGVNYMTEAEKDIYWAEELGPYVAKELGK